MDYCVNQNRPVSQSSHSLYWFVTNLSQSMVTPPLTCLGKTTALCHKMKLVLYTTVTTLCDRRGRAVTGQLLVVTTISVMVFNISLNDQVEQRY